ncbi:hypothetical protein DPEC_G00175650 [Dallia pectoralis]|uniref:Uncharacterized protein n=1 Tax=Dallia pectoralis TaxID=75939 RepID=A0ACC2GE52_DALPE|nr:hypothetical protein DPEC_G00175650 [Dallia pectoralis]
MPGCDLRHSESCCTGQPQWVSRLPSGNGLSSAQEPRCRLIALWHLQRPESITVSSQCLSSRAPVTSQSPTTQQTSRTWDPQTPSHRMGLQFLLLTSVLFSTCQVVTSQREPTIRSVALTIEPSNSVQRRANVTVRCQAKISSYDSPKREYTFYQDSAVVLTQSSNTSEDALYHLPDARVSNNGKYKCRVSVPGANMDLMAMSLPQKLAVTGLVTPIFHIDKKVSSEGETVKMSCSAPGESGRIIFTFYENAKDLEDTVANSSHAEMTYVSNNAGVHTLHCDYKVVLLVDSVSSSVSNVVTMTVKELDITPVISVRPHGAKIVEGDEVTIACGVSGNLQNSSGITVFLLKGQTVLSSGQTEANHSMSALAKHSGKFECELKMGTVFKQATANVTITELFSKPVLVMDPTEVFEQEKFRLTCKSANYSRDRISASDIKYSIYKDDNVLTLGSFNGIHVSYANLPSANGKYFCKAQSRIVYKNSENMIVKVKVPVSKPHIMSVTDKVIVKVPFLVRCASDRGSLPITYTLLHKNIPVNSITALEPRDDALFSITIQNSSEKIRDYSCSAMNHRHSTQSNPLNTTVIVPLSKPKLGISTDLSAAASEVTVDIAEGYDIFLVCSVEGSHPVSFKWYRKGNSQPLFTSTSIRNTAVYPISQVNNEVSGIYYCIADNPAKILVQSQPVTVEVKMAGWKKGLIISCCLLVVVVVVTVAAVQFFKSKRGTRENATELSVKPSSPKSDDSLTVSLTHDTMEVYTPPKDAAPHHASMMGRATNGTRGSVISLPADNSNRTSYMGVEASGSVWTERPVNPDGDLESAVLSNNEPDVEYTEVVHPKPEDSARVPVRKDTETVYSEVQNSQTGRSDDGRDHGSVEYADLNSTQPDVHHALLEADHHDHHDHHDHPYLPAPVD